MRVIMNFLITAIILTVLSVHITGAQYVNLAVVNFYSDQSTGQGFSETLTEKLATLQHINVIQREALRPVMEEMGISPGQKLDLARGQSLGKTLGADYLLSGTLKEKENKITVIYQLFDVTKGTVVAEEAVSGKKEKLFDLQGEISVKVAKYFNSPVTSDMKEKLYFMPTKSMESFDRFSRGLQLYEGNRIDEAYSFFLNSVKSDTAFLDAHRYFEYTARKTGKLDDFIKTYEKMLSSDPDNAVLLNYLGNAYLDKGNFTEAENLYKKSIGIEPAFGNPHNNLATIYVMGQKYKEGLEEFQKALKYSDRKAPVFYNIGLCYINMGDKDKAKEYFMKALEIDKKNPDFIAARYYLYGVKILVTSREKHVPGEVFGEILLNSEPVFEIQTSVGGFSPSIRASIIAGRLENMISGGLKPVEIEIGKIKNETVLQTAGGQLIMTFTKKMAEREGSTPEKLAKAKMETLKKILTSATSVSYSEGGFVLQGQGEKIKDMKGISTEATYLHRGDAFYSEGNKDKAAEEYKKALEVNSSFSPAYFCMGIIYFEQKDYKNAISNFSNAIKYNDKNIDACIWLGKSFKESGNVKEAKESFTKALKLDPGNKEVKGYMEKI